MALVVTACGGADSTDQPSATTSQAASDRPAVAASESVRPASSDDQRTHVVQSGDTLSAIAKQFDTTVEAIVAANEMTDPDVLAVGDELIIPADE